MLRSIPIFASLLDRFWSIFHRCFDSRNLTFQHGSVYGSQNHGQIEKWRFQQSSKKRSIFGSILYRLRTIYPRPTLPPPPSPPLSSRSIAQPIELLLEGYGPAHLATPFFFEKYGPVYLDSRVSSSNIVRGQPCTNSICIQS